MKWTRRDIIKGLGGLPIAGAIWWAGAASSVQSRKERTESPFPHPPGPMGIRWLKSQEFES